ncbi:MAG TPA: GDSL-type esterase/lipase family protein [Caulobacteraceae bacterium]|jgi:lysophospholipase L1-like esterase|nr:GDSL-type esterase/lipase family protein [Caulobacteraceae bacterium]
MKGRARSGRAALGVAAALVVGGDALAQTPPPPATLPDGIEGAENLAPFFQALQAVKSGARTRPVHIIQLGDSHTAADHITGALRARLQANFGEGGRGALPPGRPYAGYAPRQVNVAQSDGWRLDASFLPANWTAAQRGAQPGQPAAAESAHGPFGLSGWRLVSTRPGATLTLTADPEASFDHATVCALAGPGAGAIVVTAGDTRERIDLNAPASAPVCRVLAFTTRQSRLDLVADGAPVSLLSFATFRDGGVVLSNFGVIGTTLADFAARDDSVMQAELTAYQPDLLVLAFGTNDGFEKDIDGALYEAEARRQIERLKRLAPGVPVLVLGPPDANRVRPDIPEDGKADLGFACAPLSPSEIADYNALVAEHNPELARWYPPVNLGIVREAQRQAAVQEKAAFWDWSAAMGGPCSAHHFSQADPRLVRGDHIHFTTAGGERVADLLAQDLLRAYSNATTVRN